MLDGLRALVDGGIPQGTVTLLTGSPGTGKSTLAVTLFREHLARGGAGIVVTTEASPAQMIDRSELYGAPLRPFVGDGLWFLDCYSWRAGSAAPPSTPNALAVRNLGDLSGLSIALGEKLEALAGAKRPLLILFDSPSTLTLHAPGAAILKLLEVVFARSRTAFATVLVPIERDMHEPAFTATLAAMCDGQLDFRIVEEHEDLVRQMRVLSMRTARASSGRWTRVRLDAEGLSLDVAAAGPAPARAPPPRPAPGSP